MTLKVGAHQTGSPVPILDCLHTVKVEYSGDNISYIGITVSGSATTDSTWLIHKFTFDSDDNLTDVKFADSSTAFDKVWDSRATYTYG